jgi:UDP-2-acetamido-3-amino-2,3-dideoxy-glucuronate N-acetyltransferase
MTFIHDTAIIDKEVQIGEGSYIWHFSHVLKGTIIGKKCTLGQNVMIGPKVEIGDGCKIQNNVSIYEGVKLGSNVFCGPSCVFTNVINPRAFIKRKNEYKFTFVGDGATLGANCTIICGVNIGQYAFIGAGAVVTKDVENYALVIGNPAKKVGWVSESGVKLGKDLVCPDTNQKYLFKNNKLVKEK